jgi:hypothetical protein
MCQGCDDLAEFQAAMDAHIAKVLPAMLSRAEDVAVLFGNPRQDGTPA